MSRYLLFFWCTFFTAALGSSWQDELRTKVQNGHFPKWMAEQIQEDLSPFQGVGITQQDIQETLEKHRDLLFCSIQNNQLSYCPPISSSDHRSLLFIKGLTALIEVIALPDVHFFVFTSEAFIDDDSPVPVFTWCRHLEKGKRSVCFPDYEALNGNCEMLAQVAQGNQKYPWEAKRNQAIWRGTLTGGWAEPSRHYMTLPRIKISQASLEFPDLIDAKLVGQIGRKETSTIRKVTLPYVGNSIPITEHLQYKYQILVDGHVAAFSRAYWQLFSNAVIFKQVSPWYQWFYRALHPYEHYIPFQADASDLAQKIQWLIDHDELAFQIANNARAFAEENLKYSDVMLYVYRLLHEYAKIQSFNKYD